MAFLRWNLPAKQIRMEGGWEKECPPQKTCWWSIQVLASSLCENHRKVRPGIVRIVTHAYQHKQKFLISIAPNCVTKNTFYVTKDTVLPSVLVTFLTESNLVGERVYLVDTSRSLRNSRQVFGFGAAHNFMKCLPLTRELTQSLWSTARGSTGLLSGPLSDLYLTGFWPEPASPVQGMVASHNGLLLPYQ